MSLLNVNQVSVSIDHELPILHDINLEIREGETHVLMGPNGAG
ncbi:MAG: ABC transporter ATP-binding protein, partial [Lachnospiraceae bacterium]|nr:ABC transporter ATP-binding protein [Lachnospiraceae bacterium]